ncbi:unnamed protein product [Lactuca saligna]|uniref:Vesicle-fusing ATPase n=1 Tax=Lactuca saligna TaxID=75948 RepID=A0AA35YRY6_LACSI|nr:unnamed protein product [Lactuca saligna]
MLLAKQVKVNRGSPLVTVHLERPSGSGKTAMVATVGISSDFPYLKIVAAPEVPHVRVPRTQVTQSSSFIQQVMSLPSPVDIAFCYCL